MRRRKIRNVWNLRGKIAYSRKSEKKKVMFSEGKKESDIKHEEDRLKRKGRERMI